MKKETRNFIIIFVLLIAGAAVLQYIENANAERLENKIMELEDKNTQLEGDNLVLNYQLCDIKKDNSKECESIRARVELNKYVKEEIKRIYKENFENN